VRIVARFRKPLDPIALLLRDPCAPYFCLWCNGLDLAGELGFEPRFSESESASQH
jgi:hypothetical protein